MPSVGMRGLAGLMLVALVAACSGARGEFQALAGGVPAASQHAPAGVRSEASRWFLFPVLVEARGGNLDTRLSFSLGSGARGDAALDLHLFHADGRPHAACAPCAYELTGRSSAMDVALEALVAPSASSPWHGFGVVAIGGPGADGVTIIGGSRNDNGDRRDDMLLAPIVVPRPHGGTLRHVLEVERRPIDSATLFPLGALRRTTRAGSATRAVTRWGPASGGRRSA